MASVLIVEDEPETRRALEAAVRGHPALSVLASVGTLADGLRALHSGPDVVLVDLGLPDGSGEGLIRVAAAADPAPEILVITVFGDERHVMSAIEAGAAGYLLKDAEPHAIAGAILDLLAGGSPITPVIARRILKRFHQTHQRAPRTPDAPHLTPREIEVLELVSRGYTNAEIADLLGMSFHTVTSHVKQIYRKLSVRSRSAAIFEATQLGLIDLHR